MPIANIRSDQWLYSVCALETTKSATESVFSFFRAVRLETDSWKVVRALLLRRESEHTHTFREITLWPRAQIQPSSGRIIHGLCVHFFCVLYYGFFLFGQFTTSKGCTAAPVEREKGEMDDHDT